MQSWELYISAEGVPSYQLLHSNGAKKSDEDMILFWKGLVFEHNNHGGR